MPNYLQLPPELQSLIEKRDAERRLNDRRATEGEGPPEGKDERRQSDDRRSSPRREID